MKKIILISLAFFTLLIGGETCKAAETPLVTNKALKSTRDIFMDKETILNRSNVEGNIISNTKDIFFNTDLQDYTHYDASDENFATDPQEKKGEFLFKNTVKKVVEYVKKLLLYIAILFTVWSGMNLIMARGEEEEFTKRRRHIYGMAIGFIILALATIIVDDVFFGEKGEVLLSEENVTKMANEGVSQLRGIFKYFVSFGVIAGIAFVIFSAIKMLVAGGEDESHISKLKRRMVFVIMGIAMLVSTNTVINLFTKTDGRIAIPEVNKSVEFMVEWANFILGLIGVIAVFTLIYGGIRLITNFGQDEQGVEEAKKVVIAAVIGLVVAFSAWTLMYAFLVH